MFLKIHVTVVHSCLKSMGLDFRTQCELWKGEGCHTWDSRGRPSKSGWHPTTNTLMSPQQSDYTKWDKNRKLTFTHWFRADFATKQVEVLKPFHRSLHFSFLAF